MESLIWQITRLVRFCRRNEKPIMRSMSVCVIFEEWILQMKRPILREEAQRTFIWRHAILNGNWKQGSTDHAPQNWAWKCSSSPPCWASPIRQNDDDESHISMPCSIGHHHHHDERKQNPSISNSLRQINWTGMALLSRAGALMRRGVRPLIIIIHPPLERERERETNTLSNGHDQRHWHHDDDEASGRVNQRG